MLRQYFVHCPNLRGWRACLTSAPAVGERKGLGGFLLDQQWVRGWTSQALRIDTDGWGKASFPNGRPLGRYREVGPQVTLYAPAAW